ncbi:MAG: RIP metalloprotease RseP [Tenericutes bacterium]|nr:RIP metalloprotease RseP [Mycoplasmatota bacterium]
MLYFIFFVLILGITVLIHELGHFIFAKIFNIYVYEFSIGMGPKLFSKKDKKNETSYSLRAIPIGGFVSLAGEEVKNDDKIPSDRKLQAKKPWQRFLVMFFGAGSNFIFAICLLFIMGLFLGSPSTKPIITEVEKGYPAELAGIEAGDLVVKMNNHKIKYLDDMSYYFTVLDKNEGIIFKVKKTNGKFANIDVKPIEEEGNLIFGVTLNNQIDKGFKAAVKYAYHKNNALFKQMFMVVGSLFNGQIKMNSLSGPIGIYSIVGQARKSGIGTLLYLLAFLGVNVGFINLLPFPAFDGGRILFLLIEKIKGKPIKTSTENTIHSIGFVLLMLLLLFVTINDIIKLN